MLFLADHIVARKTSSSYSTLPNSQKAAAMTPNFQAGGAAPTFARPSASPSPPVFRSLARLSPSHSPSAFRSTVARPSPSPPVLRSNLSPEVLGSSSTAWSSENELFPERDESDTSNSRNSTRRSLIAVTAEEALVSPGVSQSSPSQSNLQAIKEAGLKSKRTVPEPDNFAVKKKRDDDMLTQAIVNQIRQLSSMTAKFNDSMNPTSSIDNSSNSILHAISIALQGVPVERHLEFMLEVVSIIKEKYVKAPE